MDKIKVALIGIGGMGGVHYNCYKNIDNAEIIAVADVRTDIAKEKVDNENIKIYETLDELLAAETPDMVDICTPSYMHKEMTVKCLKRGLHVLCEKPMSLNTKDTAEVLNEAKNTDKLFMTAHVVRFMTPYIYLKKVIQDKSLGNLLRLDMKRISSIPLWSWEDWMRDPEKSGGTPVDLSIHDIDFVQYVLGTPKSVSAVYHKLNNNSDFIISNLIYDKCLITAEGTWYNYDVPFSASFTAVFDNGIVELKDNKLYQNGAEIKNDITDNQKDDNAQLKNGGINIKAGDGYTDEIQYFVDCISNGNKPEMVTPESSHNSIALVEKILKNAVII